MEKIKAMKTWFAQLTARGQRICQLVTVFVAISLVAIVMMLQAFYTTKPVTDIIGKNIAYEDIKWVFAVFYPAVSYPAVSYPAVSYHAELPALNTFQNDDQQSDVMVAFADFWENTIVKGHFIGREGVIVNGDGIHLYVYLDEEPIPTDRKFVEIYIIRNEWGYYINRGGIIYRVVEGTETIDRIFAVSEETREISP